MFIYFSLVIGFFSLLTHKEYRFILMTVPMIIMIPIYGLYNCPKKLKMFFFIFNIILNSIAIGLEESHYRCGALDLMDYVRKNE